jgi:hypothetical protein
MTVRGVLVHRSALLFALPSALLVALLPAILGAQRVVNPADFDRSTPEGRGRIAQFRFEEFRRKNLPELRGTKPGQCDEQVGRFCYWYDERAGTANELPVVAKARDSLVRELEALDREAPGTRWLIGQRVRYLAEANRLDDALAVATQCRMTTWFCDAAVGFVQHLQGRYAAADSTYARVLRAMSTRDRCQWRDLTLYIDDDTRGVYRRNECGTAAREAFEARVWFLARTLYGTSGNDTRTEHFARRTYALFLADAPSVYPFGFDDDEKEMSQRFGWPRWWARGPGGGREGPSVVGQEAVPAYRMIPPWSVLENPANSDSTEWAVQKPPVIARYAPPYAAVLRKLRHQQAMFRRGDSALVAMAWSVEGDTVFSRGPRRVTLALVPSDSAWGFLATRADVGTRGVLTASAPWGPLLMSAEVTAPEAKAAARARYGVRPPEAVGTRVTLSDLLFFRPYGSFPRSVAEVLPAMLPTEIVRNDEKLGVYWEAYGTNPGEPITLTLTVAKEIGDRGMLARGMQALNLAREATPVRLVLEEPAARATTITARGVEIDIGTLAPGAYVVQLEVSVGGQYVIRAERRMLVEGQTPKR